MTSLLAIGDIHMRPDARNPQRLRAWDQVIADGLQRPTLGGWVLAGDLFHTTSTADDRNAARRRIQAMAQRAPVIGVRGNHDGEGELEIFTELAAPWPVYFFERPECCRVRLATGQNVTVFALPYPHKGALVAAGLAPGADVFAAAEDALEAIFRQAGGELAAAQAAGDATFMVGHGTITGAIASNGQPQIGREITISPRHLDLLGPILKIFGHIHKPQEIAGAHYVGSIARQDYGEIEEKRVLVAELAADSTYTLTSVPVDGPPMWHVEGQLTREGFTWTTTAGPDSAVLTPPASWKGCEVRVRYRFNQSDKSVLNEAHVLAEFAEAAALKLEPIAVPDRALRAPAVVEAQTLAEKVSAWADVAGATTSEALLAKLARLEQTDPVALIADMQAWVAEVEATEKPREVAA